MQILKMDFQSQSTPPVVPVMQSDAQSRFIGIALYDGGAPYAAPENAAYTVQYHGPGPNNIGWYDTITLSSGTRKAVTVDSTNKNIITLELAEQALRVNGNVFINLCVVTSTGYMLHTFPILCRVTGAAYIDPVAVRSFFYVTGITSEQWLAYVTACQDAQNRAEAAAATFQTDPTLSLSGKAADAAKVGEAVNAESERAKGVESQLKEDIVDLDELFNWASDKTNILNGITPVTGEYVDYSNGSNGRAATYEWYEVSVTEGQTFKYNGNKTHVAFFSEKYTGLTNEYYLSGLLTKENVVFTVPKNAVSMTLSVPIDYPNWLGKGDDKYQQNTTIKKECLPKDKQIIVCGSDGTYTNIVKAVKECKENETIIVRSGTYDLEAQFKEVYGDDFFVNYKGYIADSNFELSGLYLKRGVKLIANSGAVLSFMYTGNNPKVSEEFSPINMTVDNIVDGFIIEVNSNVRYHIHDDFAFMAFMNINNYGQNEIKNCVFKGNSTAGSAIGGGMGTYCRYIVHDNFFENTAGNAVSYHNASFRNAQNFIDIFNNYAKTPIKLWWYGDSTKITTALVHNNTASLIECAKIPNYNAPNENIKMKAWNNNIV